MKPMDGKTKLKFVAALTLIIVGVVGIANTWLH